MSPPFSAVILAAGHSTRMGRDKALLEFDGVRLWQHQRETLVRAGAAELLLSARPEQTWTREAAGFFSAVVHDARPQCGPLAGITAALERAVHSHLSVLAIDLPQMTAAWFRGGFTEIGPGVGVVGRRGRFFEPLAAIYPRELMPLTRAALARGELSLQRLLAAATAEGLMKIREVDEAVSSQFENWNEPR